MNECNKNIKISNQFDTVSCSFRTYSYAEPKNTFVFSDNFIIQYRSVDSSQRATNPLGTTVLDDRLFVATIGGRVLEYTLDGLYREYNCRRSKLLNGY